MNIIKLEYFLCVAKHLNFTKAANEMHIAQTAMSRHISNLEKELDVILFHRDNRKVELTSAGKKLFFEATNFLGYYYNAIIQVKNTAQNYTSSLKIGIGTYDRFLAGEIVKTFSTTYPQVELSIDQYDYKTLTDKLVQGHLDIIFCINKYTPLIEDIASVTINQAPWKLAVSSENPLSQMPSVDLVDLNNHKLVTMNYGPHEDLFENNDLRKITFDYIRVNSLDAKLLIVESNLAIAFLPSIIKITTNKITLVDIIPSFTPRLFEVAYLKTNNNKTLNPFLQIVNEHVTLGESTNTPLK